MLTAYQQWVLTCSAHRAAIQAAEARGDAMSVVRLQRALREIELKRPPEIVAPDKPEEGAA